MKDEGLTGRIPDKVHRDHARFVVEFDHLLRTARHGEEHLPDVRTVGVVEWAKNGFRIVEYRCITKIKEPVVCCGQVVEFFSVPRNWSVSPSVRFSYKPIREQPPVAHRDVLFHV